MTIGSSVWIAGAFATLVGTPEARADGPSIRERPGHITEETISVDATPSQIYALVTDYANWQTVLSDVTSVTVKSGGREDASVRFTSHALDNTVTVVFTNVPDQRIVFRGVDGPPGGRASGSYELVPIDGGAHTLVRARLYLDVVGVAGLFVRDSTLRSMRQTKLRADLTDVAQHFSHAN